MLVSSPEWNKIYYFEPRTFFLYYFWAFVSDKPSFFNFPSIKQWLLARTYHDMFFFSSPSPSPNTALGGPDPFIPLLRYANHSKKDVYLSYPWRQTFRHVFGISRWTCLKESTQSKPPLVNFDFELRLTRGYMKCPRET